MEFFVVTLLSIVTCGPGQSMEQGNCRVDKKLYEANSPTEAEQDWQTCLKRRAALLKKHPSVECDQWDPNQKTSTYQQQLIKLVM